MKPVSKFATSNILAADPGKNMTKASNKINEVKSLPKKWCNSNDSSNDTNHCGFVERVFNGQWNFQNGNGHVMDILLECFGCFTFIFTGGRDSQIVKLWEF